MFSNHFDADVKNNFKKIKKNIILMCFGMKNTLKSNGYHTLKHPRNLGQQTTLLLYF
jgi:hypothetical protein